MKVKVIQYIFRFSVQNVNCNVIIIFPHTVDYLFYNRYKFSYLKSSSKHNYIIFLHPNSLSTPLLEPVAVLWMCLGAYYVNTDMIIMSDTHAIILLRLALLCLCVCVWLALRGGVSQSLQIEVLREEGGRSIQICHSKFYFSKST